LSLGCLEKANIASFSRLRFFWQIYVCSYFEFEGIFPKKKNYIVGWPSVKTSTFPCYIRPDLSKPHPGGVVARHMSRLTVPVFAVLN